MIVCETDQGWLLDHELAINTAYSSVRGPIDTSYDTSPAANDSRYSDETSYRCLPALFDIKHPFMMDSEWKAMINKGHHETLNNRRKRKRKLNARNQGEVSMDQYHQEIRSQLLDAYKSLVEIGRQKRYFMEMNHEERKADHVICDKCLEEKTTNRKLKQNYNTDWEQDTLTVAQNTDDKTSFNGYCTGSQSADKDCKQKDPAIIQGGKSQFDTAKCSHNKYLTFDNNVSAREAANIEGPGCLLAELSLEGKNSSVSSEGVVEVSKKDPVPVTLFNTLIANPDPTAILVHWLGGEYLLPGKCRFLMSDFDSLQPLMDDCAMNQKYDLIVLDPPWENKSVKRKKGYFMLTDWDLYRLPIPRLASPGCLIAVWVTNKQKQIHFLKEKLFPHWGVKMVAEWHWVKVTKCGEMVYDFDSPHKKPYENIVIGRLVSADSDQNTSCYIPDHKVLISCPCSLHSKKVPLMEVLSPYLPPDPHCLEMFARNLMPGWTSWGNEVLKHQHVAFFEREMENTMDMVTSDMESMNQLLVQ